MSTWKMLCASMTMAIVVSSAPAFAQSATDNQSGPDTGASAPSGPVMQSPSDVQPSAPSPPSQSPSDTMSAPAPSTGVNSDCDSQPSAGINEETAPGSPRQVAGHVVALDRDNGTLTLQTDGGLIQFRGSPDALQDVNVGDAIVVEYMSGSHATGPNVAERGQEGQATRPGAPCNQ